MRILTVTNSSLELHSGSGYSVRCFSEELQRRGHQVEVVGPEGYEIRRGGGRCVKLRQCFGAISILWKYDIKEFDLLECYGDEFGLLCAVAKRIHPRLRIIYHTNGLELAELEARARWEDLNGGGTFIGFLKQRFYRRFSLFFLRYVNGIATLSEYDAQVARRFSPSTPVQVIHPGIADCFQRDTNLENREVDLLFVGSWIQRKGAGIFASVSASLMEQGIIHKIAIAGTGEDLSSILDHFSPNLWERITVHPILKEEELARVYQGAKILLHPTIYEGFGLVTAQAAACGVVVVTPATGWAAELEPEKEYYPISFTTRLDDTREVEKVVALLMKDPSVRISVSAHATRRARKLSWNTAGSKLEDFYTLVRQLPE